ncbi:hypothetical protein ACR79B_19505 [Sphingobacterium spiritivorum]|uniref:hypothetical protein n=1 Tax=Sphingobacterium spiritivorum TaxID=258 RepID=UPI003DA2C119
MNQTILIISFLLFNLVSYCQPNKMTPVSDSTVALGIIQADVFLGNSFSDRNFYTDKYLDKNTVVILCGAKNGVSDNKSFEVVYNNKTYFVDVNNVETNPINFEIFNSANLDTSLKFRKAAINMGKVLYAEKLEKAFSWIDSTKPYGIVLTKNNVYDESEYTDGTGVEFEITNTSKKTIKYVTFNFTGYNAVNDKVITAKTSLKSRKGIGPIGLGEGGSYTFEYVWFTDIVEYMKVNSIKLQYTDGTFKTITNISSIKMPIEYKTLLDEYEE